MEGGQIGPSAERTSVPANTPPPGDDGPTLAVLDGQGGRTLPTHLELMPYDRRGRDRRKGMVVERRRVAVLLPCRNEEATIAAVVADFRAALPDAQIWVYDNGSDDRTSEVAAAAGALVRHEPKAGKGNVVRRMFAQVNADVYVLADGDGTYDAQASPAMIDLLVGQQLDMVVGRRRTAEGEADEAYRAGHRLGNRLLSGVVRYVFGSGNDDMLSGYRVLSKRYVKSFPAGSRGFETETEMTVHALDLNLPFDEVDTVYTSRPANSHSKLRTIPDGFRILSFIVLLLKDHRPATFFGVLGGLTGLAAAAGRLLLWHPLVSATSHGVAVAAVGTLTVLAVMLWLAGLILDSTARSSRELKRLMYLRSDPPGGVPMGPETESRRVIPAARARD